MSSNIGFELDFSSLPKLKSKGDNYTEWRSAWTVAFKYAGLWTLVSGSRRRPTPDVSTTAGTQEQWDTDDSKALVMLMSSVDSDLIIAVTTSDNAASAWTYLANRFDRDTSNHSIAMFKTLTSLRYTDGADLREHLDEFHQLWQRLYKRSIASNQPVAKALRPVFESDDVKGSFFLTTLPEQMDHVVDNLATRNVTAYASIEAKMLDIADQRQHKTASQTSVFGGDLT